MQLPARLRWLWLTLAVVVADRASKAWFETHTSDDYRHEVIRHFIYLVHTSNSGIAFSMLQNASSPWVRIALIAGSLVVIGVLAWMLVAGRGGGNLTAAGLALLLAGAAGNLTDRVIHGAVTDFFEVLFGSYHYPAFNVADAAITVGAVLVVLDVLFGHKSAAQPK